MSETIICPECNKRPVRGPFKCCFPCNKRRRELKTSKCISCGIPMLPNYQTCYDCKFNKSRAKSPPKCTFVDVKTE